MNNTWTRDQLLVAFNLYCKIPFSKTKANNPSVVRVARLINRSPASVAMKLGNFGSFDPACRVRGLQDCPEQVELTAKFGMSSTKIGTNFPWRANWQLSDLVQ